MVGRRYFLSGLLVALTALFAGILGPDADAGPRRRRRRRARGRVRRRVRRPVRWRVVGGRRRMVVPVAVAVGWELAYDEQVVVVKEVHEHHIVVEHPDGKTEKVEVVKEDTEENGKDLEGSEIEEEDPESND